MSYERRLEIEALPAEPGWGKWVAVIGCGTTLVERKNLTPVLLWVVGSSGPLEVEVYQYERWRFAEEISPSKTKPANVRRFFYTRWHSDTEYTDYSPHTADLSTMCAATREALCAKALAALDGEIQKHLDAMAPLEERRNNFL